MQPAPIREAPDREPDPALIAEADRALSRGGLVAMPTETVYGIGARADDDAALARLAAIKRRDHPRGFSWHVGSASALERFPRASPLAQRLAARYWPGPLTLVLPGAPAGLERISEQGWTGVRFPAQRATAGVLAALAYPVVLSSANLHGEAPLTEARAVAERFGAGLALVLDGGPSRLAESSCVLRIGRGRFEILRPGLYELEQLRAVAGLRIAFACTGNTCRSPMAEGLARKQIAERLETAPERIADFGFEVASMGIFAAAGAPPARLAVQVMKEESVDIGEHRARLALAQDVESFDRVYCMTRAHLEALAQTLPPGRAGNLSLLDPKGADVPDPIGGTRADYRSAADRIRAAIDARIDEWA